MTGGSATQGVDFVLTRFGAISGTVTDAVSGTPLPSRYVNVYDATGSNVGFATTDSAGSFRLDGLPAGTYFAMAAAPQYVPELYDGILCMTPCTVTDGTAIPVALNSEVVGIDFGLTLLGRISGTITDAETDQRLAYRNVAVYDATGSPVAYAYTDGTGTYVVSGLAAGSYFVSSWGNSGYVEELYDNLDCGAPCDVTKGTPVDVTVGTVRAGVDFTLHKPYFADVGLDHWARRFVEGVYVAGVTAGCDEPASVLPGRHRLPVADGRVPRTVHGRVRCQRAGLGHGTGRWFVQLRCRRGVALSQ